MGLIVGCRRAQTAMVNSVFPPVFNFCTSRRVLPPPLLFFSRHALVRGARRVSFMWNPRFRGNSMLGAEHVPLFVLLVIDTSLLMGSDAARVKLPARPLPLAVHTGLWLPAVSITRAR